jgi:hypothetical protein
MGEDDAHRVECLQPIRPRRRHGQRTGVAIAVRAQRKHVGAVRRGRVVALSGNDNRAVTPSHNEGLVTVGVSRRGQQEHPGQHLGLAVEFLIASAGAVDQLGQRVVLRVSGRVELDPLCVYGPAVEQGVAAAVVEVQVTVGHQADLIQPRASRVPAATSASSNGWRRGR